MPLDKFTLKIKLQAINRETTIKYKQGIIKDATGSNYKKNSVEDLVYAITAYNKFYSTSRLVGVQALRSYISRNVGNLNLEELERLPEMPYEPMPTSNDFKDMLHAVSIPTYMKITALKEQYRKEKQCQDY